MSEVAVPDVTDEAIDRLVDSVPTVVRFDPDDDVAMALINDVACQIVSYDNIAVRYGLTKDQLVGFIKQPDALRRIKLRRAQWQSDASVAERNRTLYGIITLDAAPALDRLLHDPNSPATSRLEAFKIAGRFAGLEAQPKGQTEASTQAPFAVTINFAGGQVTRIAPVLDGEAA